MYRIMNGIIFAVDFLILAGVVFGIYWIIFSV